MKKKLKAVIKLTATTLSNIAVVGFGLAIFNQQAWCTIIASIAFALACYLEWRVEND